jgi:hypothetical protein
MTKTTSGIDLIRVSDLMASGKSRSLRSVDDPFLGQIKFVAYRDGCCFESFRRVSPDAIECVAFSDDEVGRRYPE